MKAAPPPALRVGAYTVRPLADGVFRLDVGAMFGCVPKPLWSKFVPERPDHTVSLALRPFLIQGNGRTILLEAGIGSLWDEKRARIYGIERPTTLLEGLRDCGVGPTDVDTVVLSHLHWDHMGGAVVEGPGGKPEPAFPSAAHVVPAAEIPAARGRHARSASYRADLVEPLERAGILRPVEGRAEVAPGIEIRVLGGHSVGASVVVIEGGGRKAVFWDDLLPTSAHVRPAWIMALDLYPADSFRIREEWIARSADEGWIALLYHDTRDPWGRIVREGSSFAWRPLEAEELEA